MHSIHSLFNKLIRNSKADDIEVIHVDETDSTNSLIRRLEAERKPDFADKRMVVVTADYQTAGRGQGTHTWAAQRGQNLLFSILIHPVMVPVGRQFLLSMMEALAVREALQSYQAEDITLKWPNDIYWQDKKISGTLIETTLAHGHIQDCVFGTGVNVNQKSFPDDVPNGASLCQIVGHEVDRRELLSRIVEAMDKWYRLLANGDYADVAAFYHEALYRKHGFYTYRDKDGLFEAAIVEVEDDGHLILRDHDGHFRSYAFQEVDFVI